MLNKSEGWGIEPPLTQQRQKLATAPNCWHNCMVLAVPKQRAGGKIPPPQFLEHSQFTQAGE